MINVNLNIIDLYTTQLFALVEARANVSEFVQLYLDTFDEQPSEAVLTQYHVRVNSDPNDEEWESYGESLSLSYDYEDDDE